MAALNVPTINIALMPDVVEMAPLVCFSLVSGTYVRRVNINAFFHQD
jgi:hypothetical protein